MPASSTTYHFDCCEARGCRANRDTFMLNNADVVEWLCNEENLTTRFLQSVHDSMHEYRQLTAAQLTAVRRNMGGGHPTLTNGQVATSVVVDELAALISEDEGDLHNTDEPVDSLSLATSAPLPAETPEEVHTTAASVEGVPFYLMSNAVHSDDSEIAILKDGIYSVSCLALGFRQTFIVRTITRTTNDALRGKRVLGYRTHGGEFINIAYVTAEGTFRFWQRFRDMYTATAASVSDLSHLGQAAIALSCRARWLHVRAMPFMSNTPNTWVNDLGNRFVIEVNDDASRPAARVLTPPAERIIRRVVESAPRATEIRRDLPVTSNARMSEIDSGWLQ